MHERRPAGLALLALAPALAFGACGLASSGLGAARAAASLAKAPPGEKALARVTPAYDPEAPFKGSLDGRSVAVLAKEGGQQVLYVDGRRIRALAPIAGTDTDSLGFGFSASGLPWSWVRGGELWFGGEKLAEGGRAPLWSKDLSSFAYRVPRGTEVLLYLRREGERPRLLGKGPVEAAISEDGSTVMWTRLGSEYVGLMSNDRELDIFPLPGFDASILSVSPEGGSIVFRITDRKTKKEFVKAYGPGGEWRSDPYADILFAAPNPASGAVAIVLREKGKELVVYRGAKGKAYDSVSISSLGWDPAGIRFYYSARRGPKTYLVEDGIERPFPVYLDRPLVFSRDGSHHAYGHDFSGGALWVDGSIMDMEGLSGPFLGFRFLGNGPSWLCVARDGRGRALIALDGRRLGEADFMGIDLLSLFVSPDGGKISFVASTGAGYVRVVRDLGRADQAP
jgi:hypothetical protein